MAGRKTPKDKATPSEAPKAASDIEETEKTPAEATETAATPEKTETPEAADPMVVEETSAAVRPAEPEPEAEPEAEVQQTREPEVMAESHAAPPPAPVVVKRGPGAGPLVLGGVVAAALGFAAAQYANHAWPFGSGTQQTAALKGTVEAQGAKIAALEAQVTKLGQATSGLPGRIDKLESDLGARIDAEKTDAGARIQTNTLAIDDLKTSLSKIGAARTAADGTLPADAAAKLEALDQRVAALEKNVNGQIAAAQKAAAAEKARAEAEAERARARAALTRIDAALTAGGSFAAPVETLKAAGLSVPPELAGAAEAGVPTRATLRAEFDPAARKALAVSVRDTMGGGTWARITAFFQVQTGARSLTPRAGNSPDAVLSRAQAAVDKGDLSAAIETLKALPKAGQEAMAPWVARAETRLKAQAAAKALGAKLDGK